MSSGQSIMSSDQSIRNYEYLNNVSIVLGVVAVLLCLTGNIPKEYSSMLIVVMPILLITNYVSLCYLLDPQYSLKVIKK